MLKIKSKIIEKLLKNLRYWKYLIYGMAGGVNFLKCLRFQFNIFKVHFWFCHKFVIILSGRYGIVL